MGTSLLRLSEPGYVRSCALFSSVLPLPPTFYTSSSCFLLQLTQRWGSTLSLIHPHRLIPSSSFFLIKPKTKWLCLRVNLLICCGVSKSIPHLCIVCFLIVGKKKAFCDAESCKHTTHAKSNFEFHSETSKAEQTIDTTAKWGFVCKVDLNSHFLGFKGCQSPHILCQILSSPLTVRHWSVRLACACLC